MGETAAEFADRFPKTAEVRTTSATGGMKGVKLERFDLIPIGPLTELARHYGRGAEKYDNHQWRKGYEWSKSYSALLRHLTAFWNGENYDVCPTGTDESGEWWGDSGCVVLKPGGEESAIGWTENGRTCYNHTGGHHLDAVMWHAFALREFFDTFPEYDDRYLEVQSSESSREH